MKRIKAIAITLALCLTVFLQTTVSAASASAGLSGPKTVRAGDSITLTFRLNGSNLSGVSGTLSYDGSQLQLTGTKQKIAAPWAVEFNGNNFVAYDNNLSSPINGGKDLFTVSFTVKNVAPGTAIKVSCTDVKASDGSADISVGTVSYSAAVAAPLSGANRLTGLTVGNATLSPAFDGNTTSYTAKVPFSVSRLDIKATAEDKATVSVNNPNLTPGSTTNVMITVKAENGAKKTYTIRVTRDQDPNYKASGNNRLSGISVEGFLLSPVFNADTADYVVWLPYETESIKVSGEAADEKASVEVVGGDKLSAGQDNPVKIICTAEDGSKREYTVIAKRAAAHDGSADMPPEESSASDPTGSAGSKPQSAAKAKSDGVPILLVVVIGIVGLAAGAAGGFVVGRKQ